MLELSRSCIVLKTAVTAIAKVEEKPMGRRKFASGKQKSFESWSGKSARSDQFRTLNWPQMIGIQGVRLRLER